MGGCACGGIALPLSKSIVEKNSMQNGLNKDVAKLVEMQG